jgi:hypothetical protein
LFCLFMLFFGFVPPPLGLIILAMVIHERL